VIHLTNFGSELFVISQGMQPTPLVFIIIPVSGIASLQTIHLFIPTTAMVSLPFLDWIAQRRNSSQALPNCSRSSRQLDDEEHDDDLTMDCFLNDTPSGAFIIRSARISRRYDAYDHIARIVTTRIAHALMLTSLLMLAILAGLRTYEHMTRQAEDGYAVSTNGTKVLVLASYHDQDVTWLNRVSPE